MNWFLNYWSWNVLIKEIDNFNEPKTPLHIGEAMDCWVYLTTLGEFIRFEEIGLNTTTDDEVIEMLTDAIKIRKVLLSMDKYDSKNEKINKMKSEPI